MAGSLFHNIRISGIAGAVPNQTIYNKEYIPLVGRKAVERVINISGVEQVQRACERQTAGDLGFVAAEKILTEKEIDRNEIGMIIDITETPDYIAPSTAFVLHKRLKLPQTCIAFDVNLGCTAYVYGIYIACSLLQPMKQKYALIIAGDVGKNENLANRKNPDHSYLMMFGDAGTATLLEKCEEDSEIDTDLYADGTDFAILHTLGRTRSYNASREVTTWSDGVDRSLFDPYMDGMAAFSFATKTVPKAIKMFMSERDMTPDDYEGIYLHQTNKMTIDRIAKLVGFSSSKTPSSIRKYGNTNGATIPVTLIDHYENDNSAEEKKVLLCGFGVGLSWGVVSLSVRPSEIYPMIYTDDFYEEGEFKPM